MPKTVEEKIKIIIEVDKSCEMARVSTTHPKYNGMEGNYWDFHPGCHGINKYGDFKGHASLAKAIFTKMISDGIDSKRIIVENKIYKYE